MLNYVLFVISHCVCVFHLLPLLCIFNEGSLFSSAPFQEKSQTDVFGANHPPFNQLRQKVAERFVPVNCCLSVFPQPPPRWAAQPGSVHPLQIYLRYFGCRNKGMWWEAVRGSQSSSEEDLALEVGQVPRLTPAGGFSANEMCRGRCGTYGHAWWTCQPSPQHLGKTLGVEWWWYLISALTCFGSCLLFCCCFGGWRGFPGTHF